MTAEGIEWLPIPIRPASRPDQNGWLAPDALAVRVAGSLVETIAPGSSVVRWRPAAEIGAGTVVLLGEHDARQRLAILLDSAEDGTGWADLEDLLGDWGHPGAVAQLVSRAVAMAHWHDSTRWCPHCGGSLTPLADGTALQCAAGHREYPRVDCAVIMLITDGEPGEADERCLLGRRSGTTQPQYSALAGFCEPGEQLEDAVRREVAEEAGVRVGEVSYVASQSWPMPSSLMLGYVGRAADARIQCDQDELLDARWFTRAELAQLSRTGAVVLPGAHTLARALIDTWADGSAARR